MTDTRYFINEEQLKYYENRIEEDELHSYFNVNRRDYVLNKNLKNICWHYFLGANNIENILSMDKVCNVFFDHSYSDFNDYLKNRFLTKYTYQCYGVNFYKYKKYEANFVQLLLSSLLLEGYNIHINYGFSEQLLNLCRELKDYRHVPSWLRNKFEYLFTLLWDYNNGNNREKFDSSQFIKCLKCSDEYVYKLGLKRDLRNYNDSLAFFKDVFICFSTKGILKYTPDKRKLIIIFNDVDMRYLINELYIFHQLLSDIIDNNIFNREILMIFISNDKMNIDRYIYQLSLKKINGKYENNVISFTQIPNINDKIQLIDIINNILQELIYYDYSKKENIIRAIKNGLVNLLTDIVYENYESVSINILYSYLNTFIGYLLENILNSFNKEGLRQVFSH